MVNHYDAAASVVELTSALSNETFIPYNETNTYDGPRVGLQLLCDWPRSVKDCRDPDFILSMLIVSTILHFLVGLFGIGLIWFRNKGFDRRMVTGLYKAFITDLDPELLDNFMFFSTVACFIKVAGNAVLIVHAPKWLCIALDQLYWLGFVASTVPFGFGGMNTIPVTGREGMFAIYTPGSGSTGFPQPSIAFFYPTRPLKAAHFAFCVSYLFTFSLTAGIVSGVLQDRSYYDAARILEMVQYFSWVSFFWFHGCLLLYYGYKIRLILRACISMAKVTWNTPLDSLDQCHQEILSPAKPLSIISQFFAFGAASVFILAGSLCCVWAWWKDTIRRAEDTVWPHVMAATWTCANGITILVGLLLVVSFLNIARKKHEDCKGNSPPWATRFSADGQRDIGSADISMRHSVTCQPDAFQANERALFDRVTGSEHCNSTGTGLTREKKKYRKGSVSATKDHMNSGSLPTEASAQDFPLPPIHESTMATWSSLHSEPSARERKAQDLQTLQIQYWSVQRMIQWLHILKPQQPHPEEKQRQLHVLEQKLQEVHQQLQRLEAAQVQFLQVQGLLQTVDRNDYMASIRNVCLLNDICMLELQVETSLYQLTHDTTSATASSSSALR